MMSPFKFIFAFLFASLLSMLASADPTTAPADLSSRVMQLGAMVEEFGKQHPADPEQVPADVAALASVTAKLYEKLQGNPTSLSLLASYHSENSKLYEKFDEWLGSTIDAAPRKVAESNALKQNLDDTRNACESEARAMRKETTTHRGDYDRLASRIKSKLPAASAALNSRKPLTPAEAQLLQDLSDELDDAELHATLSQKRAELLDMQAQEIAVLRDNLEGSTQDLQGEVTAAERARYTLSEIASLQLADSRTAELQNKFTQLHFPERKASGAARKLQLKVVLGNTPVSRGSAVERATRSDTMDLDAQKSLVARLQNNLGKSETVAKTQTPGGAK